MTDAARSEKGCDSAASGMRSAQDRPLARIPTLSYSYLLGDRQGKTS